MTTRLTVNILGDSHEFITPVYLCGSNYDGSYEYLGIRAMNTFHAGGQIYADISPAVLVHAEVQLRYSAQRFSHYTAFTSDISVRL